MTHLAILTDSSQRLAESLEKSLSHGNRIRVTTVLSPREFVDDQQQIIDFLQTKDVTMVLITVEVTLQEEVRAALDKEFVVIEATSDSSDEVLGQIATAYFQNRRSTAQTTPDQQWSQQLNIPLPDEKKATPLPTPGMQVGASQQPHVTPPRPSQQPPQAGMNFVQNNAEPMPPTYLLLSVLSIVFCCFIPGVIAVVFSSQVSSKYFAGDIEGAKRASRNAEICIILSFVLGVLSATLYLPLMLVS